MNKCRLCEEFYDKYPLEKSGYERGEVHKLEHSFMGAIQCAFEHIGINKEFESDNWNCQTVNLIRDICYEGQELPPGIKYTYCSDQKYAIIKIDEIEKVNGDALWVSWYKQRGRTDAIWILDSYKHPRKPTEKELLSTINYYKEKDNERP